MDEFLHCTPKNPRATPPFLMYAVSPKKFAFPACGRCNVIYSTLESEVKPILLKILDGIEIRSEELSLFLDWLDKVRVGLWLGMKQLDDYDDNSPMVNSG